MRLASCFIVTLALAAGPATADEIYDFELTPFGGFGLGGEFDGEDEGGHVDVDDGAMYGLMINGLDSRETQWEIFLARQGTSADTSGIAGLGGETDIDLSYVQIGGTYQWSGTYFRPFLSAGVGATLVDPDRGLDNENYWSFSIGTGMQFFPYERVGFRLEARALGTVIDSESTLFCESDGGAACAFLLDGQVFWQIGAFAGVIVRF